MTARSVTIVLNAPTDGGIARSALGLGVGLASQGLPVRFLVGSMQGVLAAQYRASGIPLETIGRRTFDPRFAFELARAMRRSALDVYIAQGSWIAMICGALKVFGLVQPPIIGVEHALLSPVSYHARWGPLRYLFFVIGWLMQRTLLRGLDAVSVVSQGVKEHVERNRFLAHGRAEIIANPIDVDAIVARSIGSPGVVQGRRSLLAIGRLTPEKNFSLLVEACSLLKDLDWSLTILGEGPERPRIEQLTHQFGVASRVSLPGYSENPYSSLANAEVLVLSSDREALPTVLLEALVCGPAIVSTDCRSGPREILAGGRFGALVPCGDAPRLAAAIRAALDSGRPRDLSERRAYVRERFGTSAVIQRFKALVERVGGSIRGRAFGVLIDKLTLEETVARVEAFVSERVPRLQASINVSKVLMARKSEEFRAMLSSFDIANADGAPIVWFAPLFGESIPARVTGVDLMTSLLEVADRRRWRVYFLGASASVAEALKLVIAKRFPSIEVAGIRSGFWQPEEEEGIATAIRDASPDLLFVALGSPKQERFLAKWRNSMNVPFAMGVGGGFDIVSGTKQRAPRWMGSIGLEWLFRFLVAPRRMAKRVFVDGVQFAALLMKHMVWPRD